MSHQLPLTNDQRESITRRLIDLALAKPDTRDKARLSEVLRSSLDVLLPDLLLYTTEGTAKSLVRSFKGLDGGGPYPTDNIAQFITTYYAVERIPRVGKLIAEPINNFLTRHGLHFGTDPQSLIDAGLITVEDLGANAEEAFRDLSKSKTAYDHNPHDCKRLVAHDSVNDQYKCGGAQELLQTGAVAFFDKSVSAVRIQDALRALQKGGLLPTNVDQAQPAYLLDKEKKEFPLFIPDSTLQAAEKILQDAALMRKASGIVATASKQRTL